MKLRCPHCGHSAELLDFANEQAARQVVMITADLPKPIGRPILQYIGLFKPSSRSLSWERTLKLMQQLKHDLDRGQITRHGRDWAAPLDYWTQALTTVLDKANEGKLTLPLKNHGYLYEIISSQQSSVEAREEQKLEEKRQQAQHRAPKAQTEQPDYQSDGARQAGAMALDAVHKTLGKTSKRKTK
ncbi:hypothetical protein [Thiomicrorhabdus indica]|uniref:hypothetical protein n=1 Tax=Thiomicrorhabdus indica TaxID=2267253 RepID=UPI002AA69514|nr:hypothetical protein [Thiomicrorhabdus indica]